MNGAWGTPTYCGRPAALGPRRWLAIMPKSGCWLNAVEVGSATGVFPVSTSMEPSLCEAIVWDSDRTSENRRAVRACRGSSSQTSMPGTVVRMGLKGPRYSAGAAGLRSYVSRWLGPPHIQNKMTDVSAGTAASTARTVSRPGRVNPPQLSSPARRKSRRSMGPGQGRAPTMNTPLRSLRRDLRLHALGEMS